MDFLTGKFRFIHHKSIARIYKQYNFVEACDVTLVGPDYQLALRPYDFYLKMDKVFKGDDVITKEDSVTLLDWVVAYTSIVHSGKRPLPALTMDDLLTLQSLPYSVLTAGRLLSAPRKYGTYYMDALTNMAMTPDHFDRLKFMCTDICDMFELKLVIPSGLYTCLISHINAKGTDRYYLRSGEDSFVYNDQSVPPTIWNGYRGYLRSKVPMDDLIRDRPDEFRLYRVQMISPMLGFIRYNKGVLKRPKESPMGLVLIPGKMDEGSEKDKTQFKRLVTELHLEVGDEPGYRGGYNLDALCHKIANKGWTNISKTSGEVQDVIAIPIRECLVKDLGIKKVNRLHIKLFTLLKYVADDNKMSIGNLISGRVTCDLGSWPGGFLELVSKYKPLKMFYQHTEYDRKWIPYPNLLGASKIEHDRFTLNIPAVMDLITGAECEKFDLVIGDAYNDDGKLDAMYDESDVWSGEQAIIQDLLFTSQLAYGLKNLKCGGTIILKYFGQIGYYKLGRELMVDYMGRFEKVYMLKPLMSNVLNYERYIVMFNYMQSNNEADLRNQFFTISAVYNKHLNCIRRLHLDAITGFIRPKDYHHNPISIEMGNLFHDVMNNKFFKIDPMPPVKESYSYSGYARVVHRADLQHRPKMDWVSNLLLFDLAIKNNDDVKYYNIYKKAKKLYIDNSHLKQYLLINRTNNRLDYRNMNGGVRGAVEGPDYYGQEDFKVHKPYKKKVIDRNHMLALGSSKSDHDIFDHYAGILGNRSEDDYDSDYWREARYEMNRDDEYSDYDEFFVPEEDDYREIFNDGWE